jgi:hypothetical protein
MIRTLTAIGIALALVGSAHAQDQVTVHIAGKSQAAVRSELYRAAEAVCTPANELDTRDDVCIEATYSQALHQLHAAHPTETAAVETVAYTSR